MKITTKNKIFKILPVYSLDTTNLVSKTKLEAFGPQSKLKNVNGCGSKTPAFCGAIHKFCTRPDIQDSIFQQ